ncbi:MAG: methyltransferase [Pseudomonadota bacterium]
MTGVTEHYDSFPYPERDPEDEAKRLVTGSPSHPLEIDHFLFAGKRDWAQRFRVLVAGAGTGDAVVQMAQVLTSAGKPYEITYLDLSAKARKIAEARMVARGLSNVEFVTGDILEAPRLGPFDYIDCSGVLNHMVDPRDGLKALADAVTDTGGIGLTVHANLGRPGVASLQSAFAKLLHGSPRERLRRAKAIVQRLPENHPFKRNPSLVEHAGTDAGLFDLLLPARDRTFSIRDLVEALDMCGLTIVGQPQAHLYDPTPLVGDAALVRDMAPLERMELAEQLSGVIRTHIAYVAKSTDGRAARLDREAVPHLKGISGPMLSQKAAEKGVIPVSHSGAVAEIPVSAMAVRALSFVDGRHNLAQIARAAELEPVAFTSIWRPLSDALTTYGLMFYSRLLAG